MQTSSASRALRPLDTVTRTCLKLLLLLFVAAALLNPGHLVLGAWGSSDPCIQVPQTYLVITDAGAQSVPNLKPGVHVGIPEQFRLCQAGMGAGTRALASVPALLESLWTLGFLLLVLALTRVARRHGPFTDAVAIEASRIGWYLLGGWFVVATTHAVCFALVSSRLVAGYSVPMGFLANFHIAWAVIIGAMAAISVGRVMRAAIPLREEVEATV